MTIKECYESIGADYEGVKHRLGTDERIEKFFLMFGRDPSYAELEKGMAEGNAEIVFRMSHTLKGTAGNLSLTELGQTSSDLCEATRGGTIPPEAAELFEKVKDCYARITQGIEALKQGR